MQVRRSLSLEGLMILKHWFIRFVRVYNRGIIVSD